MFQDNAKMCVWAMFVGVNQGGGGVVRNVIYTHYRP